MANPDVIQLSPKSFHENSSHRAGVRNGPDRDAKTGDRDPYKHQMRSGAPTLRNGAWGIAR